MDVLTRGATAPELAPDVPGGHPVRSAMRNVDVASLLRGAELPPARSLRPDLDVVTTVRLYADAVQGLAGKKRPASVAVMRAPSGRVYYGTSGYHQQLDPRVAGALEGPDSTYFTGTCAEVSCINEALRDGEELEGAMIAVVHVRKPGLDLHGIAHDPCPPCGGLLGATGVSYVE